MLNGGKRFNLPLEFRNILLMQVLIQVPSSHGLGIGAEVTHGSIIMKFCIDWMGKIMQGLSLTSLIITGISSEIKTKLRDWTVWQARAGYYSQPVLSSNDSKTLYFILRLYRCALIVTPFGPD